MEINTQLLVERLTSRLDLDRIFMIKYDFLGQKHTHLLLVMNPISGLSPKIMMPVVELCLMDQLALSFEIIPFGDWKNKLSHGSMFYAYASLPQHRLHLSDRKQTKDISRKDLRGILDLSVEIEKKIQYDAAEFDHGAEQFVEQGNFLKASFMMHQSMKLRLTLLQSLVLVKTNNVQNLESRLRSLCNQFPMLKTRFLNAESVDLERLRLLDKSFHAVKQHRDLELSSEDYSFLWQEWTRIKVAIEELYAGFLQALRVEVEERQGRNAAGQKTATLQNTKETKYHCVEEDFSGYLWPQSYKDDVNKLIDHIQENHNPENIIMLNYRTGEFSGPSLIDCNHKEMPGSKIELYLIVIMKRRGPIRNRDISVGKASALVLFFELEKFRHRLLSDQIPGHRFFVNIIQKGTLLRRKQIFTEEWQSATVDWVNEYRTTHEYLLNSSLSCSHLISLIKSTEHPATNNFLLGHLIEKGVDTFLISTIGHAPKNASLDFLIDFCCAVDTPLRDYLLPINQSETEVLRNLFNFQKIWRKNSHLNTVAPKGKTPEAFAAEWHALIDSIARNAVDHLKEKRDEKI